MFDITKPIYQPPQHCVQSPPQNENDFIEFQASNTFDSAGLKEQIRVKRLKLPEGVNIESKKKEIHEHLLLVFFQYISKTDYILIGGTAVGIHILAQLYKQPYSKSVDPTILGHCYAAKDTFPLTLTNCHDIDLIIDHKTPNTEEIKKLLSASLGKNLTAKTIQFINTEANPITKIFPKKTKPEECELLTTAYTKSIIIKYNDQEILKIDITYAPTEEIEQTDYIPPYKHPSKSQQAIAGNQSPIKLCTFESLFDSYLYALIGTIHRVPIEENKYLKKLEIIENLRNTERLSVERPSLLKAFITTFGKDNFHLLSNKLNQQKMTELRQLLAIAKQKQEQNKLAIMHGRQELTMVKEQQERAESVRQQAVSTMTQALAKLHDQQEQAEKNRQAMTTLEQALALKKKQLEDQQAQMTKQLEITKRKLAEKDKLLAQQKKEMTELNNRLQAFENKTYLEKSVQTPPTLNRSSIITGQNTRNNTIKNVQKSFYEKVETLIEHLNNHNEHPPLHYINGVIELEDIFEKLTAPETNCKDSRKTSSLNKIIQSIEKLMILFLNAIKVNTPYFSPISMYTGPIMNSIRYKCKKLLYSMERFEKITEIQTHYIRNLGRSILSTRQKLDDQNKLEIPDRNLLSKTIKKSFENIAEIIDTDIGLLLVAQSDFPDIIQQMVDILHKLTKNKYPEMLLMQLSIYRIGELHLKKNIINNDSINHRTIRKELANLNASKVICKQLSSLFTWFYEKKDFILSAIILTKHLVLFFNDKYYRSYAIFQLGFCSEDNKDRIIQLYKEHLTIDIVDQPVCETLKQSAQYRTYCQLELKKKMKNCHDILLKENGLNLPQLDIKDPNLNARLEFWKNCKTQQQGTGWYQEWCTIV